MNLIGADYLLLCDDAFSVIEKGGILFCKDRIIEVGDYVLLEHKAKNKKYYNNCVITPGLCNLHMHLEFNQNNGILEYGSFGKWLDSVIKNREKMMDEKLESSMQEGIKEILRSGVAFVGAISSHGYDLQILKNSPLRVMYFNEVIGSKAELLDVFLANFKARFEDSSAFADERFYPSVAIHSPYSVHSKLLEKALEITKCEKTPLSVHFLESKEEKEWLENSSGYFAEFYAKFFQTKMETFYSIESFMRKFEDLSPYFVHCLEMGEKELKLLKNMQGKIISCPRSNRLLNNKLLDLDLIKKEGFNPIFATDGKSSNASLSILDELRVALFAYVNSDLESLAKELFLGVTNYAYKDNVLGLKGGILKKDYFADFAVFAYEGKKEQIALQLILYAKEAKALYIAGEEISL